MANPNSIKLRSEVGRPLFYEELDENFKQLRDNILKSNTDLVDRTSTQTIIGHKQFNKISFNNIIDAEANERELIWSEEFGTIEVGLKENLRIHLGQDIVYRVTNNSGNTIAKGVVVMAVGTVGASGRILIAPYDGVAESKMIMGISANDIDDSDDGFVIHFGKLSGIDTSLFSEGDVLWADTENDGVLTNTKPNAPNAKSIMAIVISSHSTEGTIFIRVSQTSSLKNDELVEIGTLVNNDILKYNIITGRFENSPTGNIITKDQIDFVSQVNGGTGAALIPAGTTAQRPPTPNLNMVRVNSETNAVERFDGVNWINVGVSDALLRSDILGTVSESSGVPTGSIIERGSNASGNYVRFADGTQICHGLVNAVISLIATPWGPLFINETLLTMPIPFFNSTDSLLSLSGSVSIGNKLSPGTLADSEYIAHISETQSFDIWGADKIRIVMIKEQEILTNQIIYIRYFVIGRWF